MGGLNKKKRAVSCETALVEGQLLGKLGKEFVLPGFLRHSILPVEVKETFVLADHAGDIHLRSDVDDLARPKPGSDV